MIKKLVSTFGIKIIIALLNLAIVILLSRFSGADGKGQASIIITNIAFLLLFCNMIGGASLVYLVPRYNTFILFLLSNIWSLIVCAMGYLVFALFSTVPPKMQIHVILLSIINSFLSTNSTILLGKEKVMSTNYILLLQAFLNFIVLFIIIKKVAYLSIDAYVYSVYLAMGACLLLSTILILPYLKKASFENIKAPFYELVKKGFVNQIGHIMKFTSFRVSYYAIVYYSGNGTLGVYSNGVALVESILLISNSFCAILYPRVANSIDKTYNQQLTLQMTKASIIICIAAIIPLISLPSEFWVWLFGNEFKGVREVIVLLSPGILLYNIALIIGHYFSGIGKYNINTLSSLLGLLSTVLLSAFVLPTYGIKEAAIISSISYFITTLFVVIAFTTELKIKIKTLIPTLTDMKWIIKQLKLSLK